MIRFVYCTEPYSITSHTRTHTDTHTSTHTHTHTHTHTDTHTHTHTHKVRYTHTHKKADTLTHTHKKADTLTHTNTQKGRHTHTCIQAFRKAIKLGPLDSTGGKVIETLEFLLNKVILRDSKRLPDALELVEEVMTVYPTYAKLYSLKGILLQKLNQTKLAIEHLEIAVKSNFISPETFYYLGVAHSQLKHSKTAEEYFRKTIIMDPNFKDAGKRLSALSQAKIRSV